MRLFAREQLTESERETVLDRGLTWYCQWADYWNNGLDPVRCRQLAQQWAAKTEHPVEAWEQALPMMALAWFVAEQENWVDIVKDLTQIPRPDDAIALAANLAPFFMRCSIWGDWDEAIACYEQSLETKRQLGDTHGVAQTLGNLGLLYDKQGKWDEAIAYYEQSLETKRQLGDRHGVAQTLGNLGNVYNHQGKWDDGIACYEQSLETKRQLGDTHGVAQTLGNLGNVYNHQGKWDDGIACYEQSLETKRQLGDTHGVGQTLANLGLVHHQRNQIEQARTLWREALTYLHPSSPEFQTVQQWLETPTPPRRVNYLLPLAVGGLILFCLIKGYWLLAILGVAIIFWLFRRSIFAQARRLSSRFS